MVQALGGTFREETRDKLQSLHDLVRENTERTTEMIQEHRSESANTNLLVAKLVDLVTDLTKKVKPVDSLTRNLGAVMSIVEADRGEKYDTPRLACVLPPWKFEKPEGGLSEREQSPQHWLERLQMWQEGDFKEGKNLFTKEKRVFLICAHTFRLVACGTNGQGYEVISSRKWVKKTIGTISVLVEITCAALGMAAASYAASTLAGELIAEGLDRGQEEVASGIKTQMERWLRQGGGSVEQQQGVSPTQSVGRVASGVTPPECALPSIGLGLTRCSDRGRPGQT